MYSAVFYKHSNVHTNTQNYQKFPILSPFYTIQFSMLSKQEGGREGRERERKGGRKGVREKGREKEREGERRREKGSDRCEWEGERS